MCTTRHLRENSFAAVQAAVCDEVLILISRYAGLALMLNALDVDLDESNRLELPTGSG
ncbi:MAG: hypothetical protein WBW75_01340 [Mycobacterium sp.]|uniref:hypothetical protein n=1 Tax=Mycobacterium sp. TaxID=1785 RepID=UPI003C455C53